MTHLYDVLDVAPTATADEIRTAWRSAVADLDPTDRRFRAYNQAAEVLLDPRALGVRRRRSSASERRIRRGASPRRNDRSETEASLAREVQSSLASDGRRTRPG